MLNSDNARDTGHVIGVVGNTQYVYKRRVLPRHLLLDMTPFVLKLMLVVTLLPTIRSGTCQTCGCQACAGGRCNCTGSGYFDTFEFAFESCNYCPVGYYVVRLGNSQQRCVPCTAGSACLGNLVQLPCINNTYQPLMGQSSCLPCGSGYLITASVPNIASPTVGNAACLTCAANYYLSGNYTQCILCPAGRYVKERTQCLQCPAGSKCDGTGSIQPCNSRTYSPSVGIDF